MVVIVVVSALIGTVYTLWSDNLWVNATITIKTGEVDPRWFFASCEDLEAEDKDVATWAVEADPADPELETLLVTIDNGYPSYRLYCELHMANTGTLPVKVKEVRAINDHPEALTVTAQEDPDEVGKELQPCGFIPAWGDGANEVEAHCRQEIQLEAHVEQGAQQNSFYRFSVEVEVEQASP